MPIVSGINDANTLQGHAPGNLSGNVPLNNGTVNVNLNADMVDGWHASQTADANKVLVRLSSGEGVVAAPTDPTHIALLSTVTTAVAAEAAARTSAINSAIATEVADRDAAIAAAIVGVGGYDHTHQFSNNVVGTFIPDAGTSPASTRLGLLAPMVIWNTTASMAKLRWQAEANQATNNYWDLGVDNGAVDFNLSYN